MTESAGFYTRLADREGFNASVRHIQRTLDLLDTCGPKNNIADEINRMLIAKDFEAEQTEAVAHMLLVEKWKYSVLTRNLSAITADPDALASEVSSWKGVDLVLGYHHPDLGYILINPKNPANAAAIPGFRKNELVVLYAGVPNGNDAAIKNASKALPVFLELLEGRKAKTPAVLLTGSFSYVAPKKPAAPKATASKSKAKGTAKKTGCSSVQAATTPDMKSGVSSSALSPTARPAPAAPAVPGQSRMTPLISVVVSNELFHNGNVEAWKRIIRSYNAKYPALQVFIYYDGERIVDINTLFKWGKVKHGSCIQFCVAGENIQDLAKLSRYFRQGASSEFEAFLKGSPDTVMNLF